MPRGALRTICWWISATGLCGAVAGVLQEQTGRGNATDEDSVPVALAAGMLLAGVNEYRRRRSEAAETEPSSSEDAGVSALKSLVMSLGVSGGLSAIAAGERVFATSVSRLLARVLSGSERLYRPVGHAAALSVLAMAIYELIRWVDHQAEHMADAVEGAFATAPASSMVSGGAGSLVAWDSLSREGRRNVSTVLGTQLIEQVMGEHLLAERPAGQRPRMVIFGESLGAWTSQDAFAHRGTQGLLDAAIDRAIWIGTPYMSKWEQESLGSDRPDVDRSLLRRFNDFGQLQALGRDARERLRYVLITHDNDGVACFGLDLLARAPDWLGPAETRPAGVPRTEQWQSPATFVQTLVDMKNSAHVIPGQFEAKGHDYRADLARFVREVYALQASDEQLASIEAALRANELQRKALIDAHDQKSAQGWWRHTIRKEGDVAETPNPEQRNR